MSLSARSLLTAAATATLAVSAPAAATAAPVLSNNACSGGDGQWGTLPLELEATSAQNGRNLDVSVVQPSVTIPSWLPAKIAPYGGAIALAIGTGTKTVAVDAWMAVAGTGSTDAPKVLKTTGTLRFTLSTYDFFNYTVSNTSLTLAPAATTSWHAPDAGGTIEVAQGAAGTLPSIPGGSGNASVQPTGSLWIRASISGISLTIDCQPGTTPNPQDLGTTFTPGTPTVLTSSTFAPVQVPVPVPVVDPAPTPVTPPLVPSSGAAPVLPVVPAPVPAPKPAAPVAGDSSATPSGGPLAVTSSSLKFGKAAVLVTVSCPAGGSDCSGSAVIKSAKKLKVGRGKAKVRKLASGRWSLEAGATGPVKLKLTKDGKKLKKKLKKQLIAVTLKPSSGSAVTKRLRAN